MTEERSTPKRGRRLAGVLAGILALGIVPFAFPASSQIDGDAGPARDISENACPDGEVPASVFTDIEDTTFEADIACVEWYDVTSGATATTYVPLGTVSRGQMATFIANVIDLSDESLPEPGDTNQFPCDVEAEDADGDPYVHYDNIQRLAQAEIEVNGTTTTIISGTGENSSDEACFSPNEPVTRAQMATFIHHAEIFLGVEITPPSTTTSTTAAGATTTTVLGTTTTTEAGGTTTSTTPAGPVFANFFDDDDESVHENNINAIATERIVVGTSERTYSPGADIRRGQMAGFLARKLDLLVELGIIDKPDPATTTTTVVGATTTTVVDATTTTVVEL